MEIQNAPKNCFSPTMASYAASVNCFGQKETVPEEAMTLLENESASVLSSGIRQRKHAMTITT